MRKNVKEALERGMEKGVQLETIREVLASNVSICEENEKGLKDVLIILGIENEDLEYYEPLLMDCDKFAGEFFSELDKLNKKTFTMKEIENATRDAMNEVAMSPDEAIACGYIDM